LLWAIIRVGFCRRWMTFAITKVLPLPVMPRSVCFSFLEKFSTSWFTAACCPGEGWNDAVSSNCIGFCGCLAVLLFFGYSALVVLMSYAEINWRDCLVFSSFVSSLRGLLADQKRAHHKRSEDFSKRRASRLTY